MMKNNFLKFAVPAAAAVLGYAFWRSQKVSIPDGVTAVQNFEAEKYLGKWYEIARFDYSFEENLSNATAEYSLNDDGSIKVLNRGFDEKKKKWKKAEGIAKFVGSKKEARLKVSFFRPIWAGYNVIDLVDYRYALVAGDSRDYLWMLSREKDIPEEIRQRFLSKAYGLDFPVENLIWVEQDKN